jgi:hypothetical protein
MVQKAINRFRCNSSNLEFDKDLVTSKLAIDDYAASDQGRTVTCSSTRSGMAIRGSRRDLDCKHLSNLSAFKLCSITSREDR